MTFKHLLTHLQNKLTTLLESKGHVETPVCLLHWMMAEEYVSLFLSLLSLERAAEIAESERGFSHQQSFGQADCAVDRLAVASQKVFLFTW